MIMTFERLTLCAIFGACCFCLGLVTLGIMADRIRINKASYGDGILVSALMLAGFCAAIGLIYL